MKRSRPLYPFRSKTNMTLRILHHNDPDGYASAHIVRDYALRTNVCTHSDIHFHSMAYGQPIPPEIDYNNDTVFMVDFSLQPQDVMEEFTAKLPLGNFVWIDHHKTSLDLEAANPELFKTVPGKRFVIDPEETIPISGCELTWKHCYPDEPIPPGIRLLGAWDTWRYTTYGIPEAEYFMLYCNSVNCTPYSTEGQEFWNKVLLSNDDPHGWLLGEVIPAGKIIKQYVAVEHTKSIRGQGFYGKFGAYTAMMINRGGNSTLFENGVKPPSEYELMVTFYLTKHGYWTVSLYSVQDHIHCGDIAKKLGEAGPKPSGGGHKGAAGFQCDWPYIEKLIERSL